MSLLNAVILQAGTALGEVALAFYVAAAAGFFPLARFIQGEGSAKQVSIAGLFIGIFQLIIVFHLFLQQQVLAAFNISVFSIIWLQLGITGLQGESFEAVGNHLYMSFIPFAILGAYFLSIGGTAGGLYYLFTWVNWTLAIMVLVLGQWVFERISGKITAWLLIIETFVTLLIPAFVLLLDLI